MPGRWTLSICKTLAVLWTLLWATSVPAAEWYKDYEAGIDHIKKGRHGEAISRLQSAIAQKNQEGLNINFYGMKFDDYLPHYYLGKVYFHQKNYQAALREFNISSSQGEIQRNRNLFQNLSELKTLASTQLALNQPATPIVPDKKPEPIQPPPERVVPEKKPDAQEVIHEQPVKVNPVPAVVQKREPDKPFPEPPAPTPEELNLQKAKTMTKDGARRYFQGDYDSAISSLTIALQLTPQDASAQFLLGCSYAAKYLLSGSADEKSFQEASAAFQRIRRMNPNHPLIKSPLISPAVREIYQKVVASD